MTPFVVYRHELLAPTETFILAQSESLERYQPVYLGLRRVEGIPTPVDRSVVVEDGTALGRVSSLRFSALGRSRRLEAAMRRVRPALVHAHFEGGGVAAMRLAATAGVPLVVTCHGFDVSITDRARWPNPLLRAEYARRRRRLQRSRATFIAVADHIRDLMVARGYPEERVVVHHIGVDPARFEPAPLEARAERILFVGRLVKKKGVDHLIRAMAAVERERPKAELVIVGDGPERSKLEQLAARTLTRCSFAGLRTSSEVAEAMSSARALCAPGVTAASGDTDGLPMVILEAQAAGLPVVAFGNGGVGKAITDGETGLLAQDRDREDLVRALLRALCDDDLWARLHTNGRHNVETRFDLGRQGRVLEALYDDIVARAAPAALPADQQASPQPRTAQRSTRSSGP